MVGGWARVEACFQKVGAAVSRSHHPWQQSVNGYEAMFMNILSGLIFFFQLPITLFFPFAGALFPFGRLIGFSSLFFISSFLLAVVSEDTESFTLGG